MEDILKAELQIFQEMDCIVYLYLFLTLMAPPPKTAIPSEPLGQTRMGIIPSINYAQEITKFVSVRKREIGQSNGTIIELHMLTLIRYQLRRTRLPI